MSRTGNSFDVDEAVRSLPVEVPGFGVVALGDMTAQHHEAFHASIAREVNERVGRFVTDHAPHDAIRAAASRSAR